MIASNSAPASFFKSYAHSYTQCIVYDIIMQFMTLFESKRLRKILKLKYIESERKKSHSTRFAKQNFVFELMQLRVLQDNLGPLLAVWAPPELGGLWGGCYGSACCFTGEALHSLHVLTEKLFKKVRLVFLETFIQVSCYGRFRIPH